MLKLKLILCSVLLCVATARADEFILSYWCGPTESVQDLDKAYKEVAECGFNYAMLPCSGASKKGNLAILDACKKYKLKYIVGDSRLLAMGPENPGFKTNLDAVISDYGKHPALGGYFLTDEPGPGVFPLLGAVNQYLLERDPKQLPFINLFPNYAPEWALGGTYEQHVERFLTQVKPRLLSFDHYALLGDGSLRGNYFENLEIIRRQGLKHDVPFALIFQVTPFPGVRDPSEEELRWQVNTALAYGAKGLLYFTYWTPTGDPTFKDSIAIIDPKGNRSPHYEQAKGINAAIKAWAPTLMKLKSTGVYHAGSVPNATSAIPSDFPVKIKGQGEFVLGIFDHQDGSKWLMIVNRNLRTAANPTLQFSQKMKGLRELSSTKGKLSSVKMRNNEVSLQLEAGGARLLKLPH